MSQELKPLVDYHPCSWDIASFKDFLQRESSTLVLVEPLEQRLVLPTFFGVFAPHDTPTIESKLGEKVLQCVNGSAD